MRTSLLWAALGTAAIALAAAPRTEGSLQADDVATIQGYEFRLEQGKECVVTYKSPKREGRLTLQLEEPCRFHRGPDRELRSVTARGVVILLVESSRPDPAEAPNACDTRVQAILIRPGAVSLSKTVARVSACLPFQWDQKMFLSLNDQPRRN